MRRLAGYADIFLRNTLASGVVPQISAIMGPCAGGAVYSPAITDFIFMVEKTSYMFITGPDVIKAVTHEEVTQGGAGRRRDPQRHSPASPTSLRRTTTPSACSMIRELLTFLPRNNLEDPPRAPTAPTPVDREDAALDAMVPDESEPALRHQGRHPRGGGRRRLLRGAGALRPEHRRRLRPARRPLRGHRGQPARGPGRRARHRRLASRARASCASATASTSR